MSIYAISDLHLAISIDKPMDIFGVRWSNYMQRLEKNWNSVVGDDDYVLIPGDISWATYLDDAYLDFKFLDNLNGKKIISKGNHDYWWTTISKLEKYMSANGFNSIKFLNNTSIKIGDIVVCATRGWKCPNEDGFTKEDEKIYNREVQRLKLSLESVQDNECEKYVMIHFPPFNSKKETSELMDLMNQYKVKNCLYGHLHGGAFHKVFEGIMQDINFKCISADYLEFSPILIRGGSVCEDG
ncbi:MAG: metallophosphoesterase [Clostridiales bacterium]|nr:metallophosphoesterase [Clostridiales bacterium]